jgi:hypothetical protein
VSCRRPRSAGHPLTEAGRPELLGERVADGVERVVGQLAALVERDAEEDELRLEMSGPDAEDGAAGGELVEGGEGLRRLERVPVGRHVHVGEQACASRDAGEPAERGHRVVPDRAHGLGAVARDGDVVAHGDVVEPRGVAGLGDAGELVSAGDRLPRLGVVARLRLDRELHPVPHVAPSRESDGPSDSTGS